MHAMPKHIPQVFEQHKANNTIFSIPTSQISPAESPYCGGFPFGRVLDMTRGSVPHGARLSKVALFRGYLARFSQSNPLSRELGESPFGRFERGLEVVRDLSFRKTRVAT